MTALLASSHLTPPFLRRAVPVIPLPMTAGEMSETEMVVTVAEMMVAEVAVAEGVFSEEDPQEAATAPRPYLLEGSSSSAHSFDDLCQRRPRSFPGLASATVKIPWEIFGRGRDGEVTIVRSHLTGNVASNDGGGIFNAGMVNLTKTKFKNNDPNDCTGCP